MRPHDILESLIVANHRITRMAARSTGNPISSGVWMTLSVLESEGPHRVGELATAARISQPGMTKLLRQLVEDEWVERIADTADSRAWLITIAPKGRAALAAWRETLTTALEPVFDDLTETQWQVLQRAAQLLSARVAKAGAAA